MGCFFPGSDLGMKWLDGMIGSALSALGLDIIHVTDFSQIAAYGVMSTPALVVDGKVVSFGKSLEDSGACEISAKSKLRRGYDEEK